MSGFRIRFGKRLEPQCSICAKGVTLELSKTDEHGQAVHEICYVQATLAEISEESQRKTFHDGTTIPAIVMQVGDTPKFEGSFWKAFEFVRW